MAPGGRPWRYPFRSRKRSANAGRLRCEISRHLGAYKGEFYSLLHDERYAALRHRLEDAHAAAATPVEARRRVEFDEGR